MDVLSVFVDHMTHAGLVEYGLAVAAGGAVTWLFTVGNGEET